MKYLFFLIIVISFYGCPPNLDCRSDYAFKLPISVIPNKAEYKVGDTIIISMITDNTQLYDSLAPQFEVRRVHISNFNPNAWFLMPKLDTIPVWDGFEQNELILNNKYKVITQFLSGELVTGIFFLEIDASDLVSKLDFKVVLNEPGTYALYSVSELWRDTDEICFTDKCGGCVYGKSYLDAYFIYDSDIHKDILTEKNKEVENYVWKDRAGQREESSPYYFRVIE